jgi:hypothetical protein
MATRLKREGAIPDNVQLWAVANPNVEGNAALAEQKVCFLSSLSGTSSTQGS